MIKVFQDTLNLICNASTSAAGYLLKVTQSSTDVIASSGEYNNSFDSLNKDIINLYNDNHISAENIMALPSFKLLSDELSIRAACCKEFPVQPGNNFSLYLLLFSEKKNNYSDKNIKSVLDLTDALVGDLAVNNVELFSGDKPGENETFHAAELSIHSEEVMKLLCGLSDSLIFVLDSEGHIVEVNNNGAMLLDYDGSELKGKHILDLADYKGKTILSSGFRKVLKSPEGHKFICTLRSKSGKDVKLEINARSVISDGKIIGMLGIAKDITKQLLYEASAKELNLRLVESHRLLSIERGRSGHRKAVLEELNELKSEFISNISHELRTPLASIIGFSETVASDPEMPEEMKSEFIQVIIQEGKRLAKLINDILDLSKIEGGKIDFSLTDIEITGVIKDVIAGFKRQLLSKKIVLTSELPDEQVMVYADKERISQVFYELITNAIKYTKEGGRITIVGQNLYREFEVIISDTGIGIPEKDIPYIFQKFYRASRPGNESPGTGLGLVFVKQIVELHKGLVLVQSEVNRGSSFIIKLPKSLKMQKNKV
jgi:PAS domain S-box-containing protein